MHNELGDVGGGGGKIKAIIASKKEKKRLAKREELITSTPDERFPNLGAMKSVAKQFWTT